MKSVEIGLSVSGDADSRAKLDSISKRAEELKAAFPEYKLKVDSQAAAAKLAVFRADMKATADAVTKPMDPQVLTGKAAKSLLEIQAKADQLRAKFPDFTVRINDREAKAKLALFAAESKVTLDKIDSRLGGGGPGLAGRIGNLVPGLTGTGGGASGLGALAPAGSGLANPYVLGGGAAAIAAAAPFAGQLAGGGIVSAFGGALAGMAILGASRTKQIQGQFAGLGKQASGDLQAIGVSFVPVVSSILRGASTLIGNLTPVFANAAKIISGPFKSFVNTIIGAFNSPAVALSISTVAGAFGDILKALTPSIPGIVNGLAGGITDIAKEISKNPKAISDFFQAFGWVAIHGLEVIAWLTGVADYIEKHFGPALHRAAVLWDGARHEIAHVWDGVLSNIIDGWDKTWTETIGRLIQAGHVIEDVFNNLKRWIWNDFILKVYGFFATTLPHGVSVGLGLIKTAWDTAWGALKSAFRVFVADGILTPLGWIIRGAAAAFGWIPGIGPKLKGAAKSFDQFKSDVNKALGGISGRTVAVSVAMTSSTNPYPGGISGRKAAGGLITAGTGPVADDVLIAASRGELIVPASMVAAGAVDHLRGRLPGFAAGGPVGVNVRASAPGYAAVESKLMASVTTLANAFAKAAALATGTRGGGGVGYAPGPAATGSAAAAQAYARSILWAYGWGPGQMPPLISLWNQESGWNAWAVNQSSGAYGIPQSLGHGHPYNLGDYANQVRWGLAYISGRYGSPAAAWGHEVANNWYDKGGWLLPGLTLAVNNTGRPERVLPPGGAGTVVNYNITVRADASADGAQIGRNIVERIRQHEKRSGPGWRK